MRTPTEQEIEFVLDFVLHQHRLVNNFNNSFPIAYFKPLVARKLGYYNIITQSIFWHLFEPLIETMHLNIRKYITTGINTLPSKLRLEIVRKRLKYMPSPI